MDRIRRYLPAIAHGVVLVSAAAIIVIRKYRLRLLELKSPPGCVHIEDPLPLWHAEPTVRNRTFPGPLPSYPELHSSSHDDYQLFCLSKFVTCLHDEESKSLFQLTSITTLSPGTCIFRKGESSIPGLVLILSGNVQLFITGPTGELEACGSMRAGHSLGAFDVIDSGNRCVTALVSAGSEARLAFLSQDAFWSFFGSRPDSMLQYIRVALSRLWRISHFMLGSDFLNLSFSQHGIDVPDVITHIPDAVLRQLMHLPSEQLAMGCIYPGFTEHYHNVDDAQECWALLAVDGSFILNDTDTLTASASSPILVGMAGLLGSSEIKHSVRVQRGPLRFIRLTLPTLVRFLGEAQREGQVTANDWTELIRTGGRLLVPVMRFFVEIGMQRVWRRSGEVLYNEGQINTDGVLVIITGRVKIEKGRSLGRSLKHSSQSQRALQAREQSVSSWFCEPPLTRNHSFPTGFAGRKSVLGVRSYSKSVYSNESLHESSAACVRDSEFVRLPPATVCACTRLVPDFPWRLVNNNNSLEKQLVIVAAIALNTESSHAAFTLIKELSATLMPNVTVIAEADIERRFGSDTLSNLHLPYCREQVVQFLHHAEEKYKHVILFANSVDSPWASIACANADITLLMSLFHSPDSTLDMIEAAAAVSDSEQRLVDAASHGRYELVLLHTSEAPPRYTRKWLITREWLFAHHHIRMVGGHVQTNDISRLLRRIAGLSIGLVLSGGGGKGLAHYGLFQALEQNRLPVDFVGGTSQGAFMGALYCMFESSEKMRPFVLRLSAYIGSTLGLLSDFTFPYSAFFSGREFSIAIRDALGKDAYIEDLWLPFFCVSTNLSSMREEVYSNGLLWAAVRSSMSVAGVLPPMWHGKDRLLCDGGYVDNLPISIMRASPFSPGSIIAVDLEDRGKQSQDSERDAMKAVYRQSEFNDCTPFTHISGWRCLWDSLKFWKQAPKIPTLLDIMKGLTGINHSRNVRMQLATMKDEKNLNFLFLEVESVYQFKLLDYDKLDEIASHCFEFSSLRICKWMDALKAKQQQRQHIKRSATMNATKSYLALDALMDKAVSPSLPKSSSSPPAQVSPPNLKPALVRRHSVFFHSDAN